MSSIWRSLVLERTIVVRDSWIISIQWIPFEKSYIIYNWYTRANCPRRLLFFREPNDDVCCYLWFLVAKHVAVQPETFTQAAVQSGQCPGGCPRRMSSQSTLWNPHSLLICTELRCVTYYFNQTQLCWRSVIVLWHIHKLRLTVCESQNFSPLSLSLSLCPRP